MKKFIFKILAVLLLLIFLISLISMIVSTYIGKNASMTNLFNAMLVPQALWSNPIAAFDLIGIVLVQLFLIWIFYFLGKKSWRIGFKKDDEILNGHE